MSELPKLGISVKYNDSGSGLFKDAQSIPISYVREYVTDMLDSIALFEDLGGTGLVTSDHLAFEGGMSHPLTASYAIQQRLWLFLFTDYNSGPVTINIDTQGAKSLKKISKGSPAELEVGDIVNGTVYLCYYNALDDYFMIVSNLNESYSLTKNTSQVLNSGTSETDLHTYTIPANTLDGSSRTLQTKYAGSFTDATATCRLRAYIGGQLIYDSGVLTLGGTGSWEINLTLITTGSSTAKVIASLAANNFSTTLPNSVSSYFTSLSGMDWTTTNIVKITGTAAGATGGSNDISCEMSQISIQK